MRVSVALRARTRLAALLNGLVQVACREGQAKKLDPRNLRTWRQLVLGVLAKRSTRLLSLAQVIAPQRQVHSVKAAAMALGYFLEKASFPMRPLATRIIEAGLRQLPAERLTSFRGKVLLVIDPTEYAKRSRGRGKKGRQMQHIGRVRQSKAKPSRKSKASQGKRSKVPTAFGYVDIWAGLVLKGKQFLPLAHQLFSSNHPKLRSQNRVEEAVLAQALGMLRRVGLDSIAVADRGLGRKELLIRLVRKGQELVFRIDADILVKAEGKDSEELLGAVLAEQAWLGEVVWDRGEEGKLPCRVRAVRGTIRFSRSGRQGDYQEATLNFLELVPTEGEAEPLVVATTLPVQVLADAKGVAWVYGQRWAVESAFEMMHSWGQERFMVRSWKAIDRLLWIVALAYVLAVLALQDGKMGSLRRQATALLRQLSVLGRHLTVGKLAEAIGLDFNKHHRAWASAWFP